MRNLLSLIFILISYFSISQSWTQKSNFGGAPRHRATAFSIGNKGYLGLGHINSAIDVLYNDIWEYDPASNSWTQKANYPYLVYHATGFSIGNKGYVGTGRKQDNSYTTDFFEYNPITNTWSPVASFPGAARRGAVSFVANNKGYVGTGQVSGWANSNGFYEYNPITDTWQSVAAFPGTSRTSSVAFTISNIGYVGTGNASGGTNDFWAYYPDTDTWVQKANVGPTPRQEATGFSVNGKGYIGTGDDFSSGTNYADMWEYTPETDTWVQIEDFSGVPRRYLTSVVIENVAYVGTGTSGTNFNDFWRFDTPLSIENQIVENISFNVYPNPSVDFITVQLNELSSNTQLEYLRLDIYSVDGKLIKSQNLTQKVTYLSKQDFKTGTYLYYLTYIDKVLSNGKFIFK